MPQQQVILFEDSGWRRLLPLVYMRSIGELAVGMRPLWVSAERAGRAGELGLWTRESVAELTRQRLSRAVNEPAGEATLFLNARARWRRLPGTGAELAGRDWVGTLGDGTVAAISASADLAARLAPGAMLDESGGGSLLAGLPRVDVSGAGTLFDWPWELVDGNKQALLEDWEEDFSGEAEMAGRVDDGAYLLNESAIRIGSGSRVKPCSVIDAEEGPVVIGRDVTIQPHCYVAGPAFIGAGSFLQAGAVLRGGASIGPVCKVGGEVEGSVLIGYSNKQHDGFLGHSYVGSFVNVAADCINSDLKNTYGTVRVPINGREVETGRHFVGLTVGDHSKAGINVSFPTGAVMGFCSSIVGANCPKFVPSFSWIASGRAQQYDADRGLAIAQTVMARRKLTMSAIEQAAFLAVRTQAMALEHNSQVRMESGDRQ